MGGRIHQLGIRLDESERAIIESVAKRASRAASDWARIVLLTQAKAEMGGSPGVIPPDPGETADLAALRQIEAVDPLLVDALLDLGRSSTARPRLALVVKELAADYRADERGEAAPRSRKGQRRKTEGRG